MSIFQVDVESRVSRTFFVDAPTEQAASEDADALMFDVAPHDDEDDVTLYELPKAPQGARIWRGGPNGQWEMT